MWIYKLWGPIKKSVLLPKAIYEWEEIKFQDFKSISDYNFDLHLIKIKISILWTIDEKNSYVFQQKIMARNSSLKDTTHIIKIVSYSYIPDWNNYDKIRQ